MGEMGKMGKIRTLDNGIHRTALLTEAAVDAFRHVNVVTSRPSTAVFSLLSLDRDG